MSKQLGFLVLATLLVLTPCYGQARSRYTASSGLGWTDAGTYIYPQNAPSNVAIYDTGVIKALAGILPDIYPAADSTTAVQILRADGTTPVLNVDTTNSYVGITGRLYGLTTNGNITILPAGTGITVIGDAGSPNRITASNDNLYVTGQSEHDGPAYFDSTTVFDGTVTFNGAYSQTRGSGDFLTHGRERELITIAAGSSTATTSTLSIPVRSTITGFVAKVTQAPGGGPTNFNVGITGGDADCLIDNAAVTVNGTFDAWENGDGTYTFFLPVTTAGGAMTFTVTTTDGADNPVAVTGASFIIRLVAFYQTRTPPTS